jgi:predicted GIY-YIG superfamily endonuclease
MYYKNSIKLLKKLLRLENKIYLHLNFIVDTIINYINPIKDRNNKRIYIDNNNKSGVYMFTNKINNKKYIGSAIDLNKRINRYFQRHYLSSNKYKNFNIVKALNKYGISNFIISILKYTTSSSLEVIKREQY